MNRCLPSHRPNEEEEDDHETLDTEDASDYWSILRTLPSSDHRSVTRSPGRITPSSSYEDTFSACRGICGERPHDLDHAAESIATYEEEFSEGAGEGSSVRSDLTDERPDCFEMGRDAGSPSRRERFGDSAISRDGGEDGVEVTDSPKKAAEVAGNVDGSEDAGIEIEAKNDASKNEVTVHDVRRSPGKNFSDCVAEHPPERTLSAIANGMEPQEDIPSVCDTPNDGSSPDRDDESTAVSHKSITFGKSNDAEENKIPKTTSLDNVQTSQHIIAPTSSFGTANETESSTNSSTVHVTKKTKSSIKTIVTSAFLKKLKSKRSFRLAANMENAASRSGNYHDDDPDERGAALDRSEDRTPRNVSAVLEKENEVLLPIDQVPSNDKRGDRSSSSRAMTTPASSASDQWSDRNTIDIDTHHAPNKESNAPRESTADRERTCNLSPTAGKPSMGPTATNDSIELDAAGSNTSMPSKARNARRESNADTERTCNLSPVPGKPSMEPTATNGSIELDAVGSNTSTPSKARNARRESAEEERPYNLSSTPGKPTMEPTATNGSIELDAVGSNTSTPSKARNARRESNADKERTCNLSPVPGKPSMEPTATNGSIELDAAGSHTSTPSKARNASRESAQEEWPYNLSSTPGKPTMEPTATNGSIELDAAGSHTLTPSKARNAPRESAADTERTCNLWVTPDKPTMEPTATNDSIELDATGSITLTPNPSDDSDMLTASKGSTQESVGERCRSFLSDVSRTLFPEELEGHPAKVSKDCIGPDPHCDFPLEELQNDTYDEAMAIECTVQNNDLGLLDVTIEEMEVSGTSASKEEALNHREHNTQVWNEGEMAGNGGVVESSKQGGTKSVHSTSSVASEERPKMKVLTFNDLFQMDMSSLGDLFSCSGLWSDMTRSIEVKKQGRPEDVVPSSNNSDTHSQGMIKNPLTSEDGSSITDNVLNNFQGKAVDLAYNLTCDQNEPSNDINDTKQKPRRSDKKNRMMRPPSKMGWVRSLRIRSQSIRMKSLGRGGNIESTLPLTEDDNSS